MAKKILALVLAVMMIAALSVSAFAYEEQEKNGSITIANAADGETYTIYKIFDLTYSFKEGETEEDGINGTADDPDTKPATNTNVAYTFTKTDKNAALFDALKELFTFDIGDEEKGIYNVKLTSEETTGEVIGNWMSDHEVLIKETCDSETIQKEEGKDVEFNDLAYGYYFITTTQGTLVTVNSTLKDVQVFDKNEQPTIEKYVWEKDSYSNEKKNDEAEPSEWTFNSDGTAVPGENWGEDNDACFEDIVYFADVIHAVSGAKNYKFTDTLGSGFDVDTNTDNYKVHDTAKDEDLTSDDYTLTVDSENNSFTVEFKETYLDKYYADQTAGTKAGRVSNDIVIFYQATVNSSATIAQSRSSTVADGNKNEFTLKFGSAGQTEAADTYTYVWKFNTFKYEKVNDTEKGLANADFALYCDSTCKTPIKLTKLSDGTMTYIYDSNGSIDGSGEGKYITTESDGLFTIQGLDAGDYWLKEEDSPAGYKLLKDPVKVTIYSDGSFIPWSDGTVKVENSTGKELPATGGIGTTIFYVVGSICVVGAAVLLLSKKRVRG